MELLFARRENEVCAAIGTDQRLIAEQLDDLRSLLFPAIERTRKVRLTVEADD
ncbi:MAG: hypothetical protein AB7T37_08905 [Dehalococcoidia bacterium]